MDTIRKLCILLVCSLILVILSLIFKWGSNYTTFFFDLFMTSIAVLIGQTYRYKKEKKGEWNPLSKKDKIFISILITSLIIVLVLMKLLIHDFKVFVACMVPVFLGTAFYILYYVITRTSK